MKNVNNDKNKTSSSTAIASSFNVEVSGNQQQQHSSIEASSSAENMNQWKDILNGFQTQLNDLRNAQVNMESTINKLLNRDTLLLEQLNDLRRNLDERNTIISTLVDNKRFIQSTSQSNKINNKSNNNKNNKKKERLKKNLIDNLIN